MKHFTIGIAGHIDHGKTTLTKALTGVETDRLKEEQERSISIEPGFALFSATASEQIAIIDVPGHERFIRQMIAGVAGVDVVVLVIAADEGVMPQTKEHIQILSALGMSRGIIVLTKTSIVDEEFLELVKHDVREAVEHTFLQDAPLLLVDSVTGFGIEKLRSSIEQMIAHMSPKNADEPFRMPIDQVFTLTGQGVIVRGTVFDGSLNKGDSVVVLPTRQQANVRQMQSQKQEVASVKAGQRAALNITGISHERLARGDVLVTSDHYTVTDRIDVALTLMDDVKYDVKQRLPVKLYVNTAEVDGKIIFFDRNTLHRHETSTVYCQLQLASQVVVKKDDVFILRRATPMETIAGGKVIDAEATKHRFNEETIAMLKQKESGSLEEQLDLLFKTHQTQSKESILKRLAIDEQTFNNLLPHLVVLKNDVYTTKNRLKDVTKRVTHSLETYHEAFPLREGMNRAELYSKLDGTFAELLIEHSLQSMVSNQSIVRLPSFHAHVPKEWDERLTSIETTIERSGAEPEKWEDLVEEARIPEQIANDFYAYLLAQEKMLVFEEGRLISKEVVDKKKDTLYEKTAGQPFTLQQARDCFGLSRKNLVPLLELFDRLHLTERKENVRMWLI